MTDPRHMTAEQRIQHVLSADWIASPRLGLVPTGPLLTRYIPRPVKLPELPETWRAMQ